MDEPPPPQRNLAGPLPTDVSGANSSDTVSTSVLDPSMPRLILGPAPPSSNTGQPSPHGQHRWVSALGYLSEGQSAGGSSQSPISAPTTTTTKKVTPVMVSSTSPCQATLLTSSSGAISSLPAEPSSSSSSVYRLKQENMNSRVSELLLQQQQALLQQHQQMMLQLSSGQRAAALTSSSSSSPSVIPTPPPVIITPSNDTSPPVKLPIIGQIMASPKKEFKPNIQGVMSLKEEAGGGFKQEDSKLNIQNFYSMETDTGSTAASNSTAFVAPVPGGMVCSDNLQPPPPPPTVLSASQQSLIDQQQAVSFEQSALLQRSLQTHGQSQQALEQSLLQSAEQSHHQQQEEEADLSPLPLQVYMDVADDPNSELFKRAFNEQTSDTDTTIMYSPEKAVAENTRTRSKGAKTPRGKKAKAPAARKKTAKKPTESKKPAAKSKAVAKKSTAEKSRKKATPEKSTRRSNNVAKKSTTPERGKRTLRRSSRHGLDVTVGVVDVNPPAPVSVTTKVPVIRLERLREETPQVREGQDSIQVQDRSENETEMEPAKETVMFKEDDAAKIPEQSITDNGKEVSGDVKTVVESFPLEEVQGSQVEAATKEEDKQTEDEPEEAKFVFFSATKNHMTDPHLQTISVDGTPLRVISKQRMHIRLYQCSRCAFSHTSPLEVLAHVETSHTEHINPDDDCTDQDVLYMRCNHCDFIGYKELSLWYHFCFYHFLTNVLPETNDRSILSVVKRENEDVAQGLSYRCPYSECAEAGDRPGSVVHHLVLEHAKRGSDDPYIYEGYTLVQEEDRRKPGRVMVRQVLVCSHCVQAVVRTGVADMMTHIYGTHAIRNLQYRCNVPKCKSQYSSPQSMQRHIRQKHGVGGGASGEQPPSCVVSVILPDECSEDPQLFFNACAPPPIKMLARKQQRTLDREKEKRLIKARLLRKPSATASSSASSSSSAAACVTISDNEEEETSQQNTQPKQTVQPASHTELAHDTAQLLPNTQQQPLTHTQQQDAQQQHGMQQPTQQHGIQLQQHHGMQQPQQHGMQQPQQQHGMHQPQQQHGMPQQQQHGVQPQEQPTTSSQQHGVQQKQQQTPPTITTQQQQPQDDESQEERYTELSDSDSGSDFDTEIAGQSGSTTTDTNDKPQKVDFCMMTTPYDIDKEMRPEFIAPITLSDSDDDDEALVLHVDCGTSTAIEGETAAAETGPRHARRSQFTPQQPPQSTQRPPVSKPPPSLLPPQSQSHGVNQSQLQSRPQHPRLPHQVKPSARPVPLPRQSGPPPPVPHSGSPPVRHSGPPPRPVHPAGAPPPPSVRHSGPRPVHPSGTPPPFVRPSRSSPMRHSGTPPPFVRFSGPPPRPVRYSEPPPPTVRHSRPTPVRHSGPPPAVHALSQLPAQSFEAPPHEAEEVIELDSSPSPELPPADQNQSQQQSLGQQARRRSSADQSMSQPHAQQQQSHQQQPLSQQQHQQHQQHLSQLSQQQQHQQQPLSQQQQHHHQQPDLHLPSPLSLPESQPQSFQSSHSANVVSSSCSPGVTPLDSPTTPPPVPQNAAIVGMGRSAVQVQQSEQQPAALQHRRQSHQHRRRSHQHQEKHQHQQQLRRQAQQQQLQQQPQQQHLRHPQPQQQQFQQGQPRLPDTQLQQQQQYQAQQQQFFSQQQQFHPQQQQGIGQNPQQFTQQQQQQRNMSVTRHRPRASTASPSGVGRGNFLKSPPNVVEADTTSTDMDVIELADDEDDEVEEIMPQPQLVQKQRTSHELSSSEEESRKVKANLRAKVLECLPKKRRKSQNQMPVSSSQNMYQNFQEQNIQESRPPDPPPPTVDLDPTPVSSSPGPSELPTGPPMLINIVPLPTRRKRTHMNTFEDYGEKQ